MFLCVLRGFAATTSVDVYLDMESGSDNSTVTAGLLNSATHGGGGVWGAFDFPDSPAASLSTMKVTTDFEPLLGTPVMVGADTYTDRETSRGYAFRNSTDRQFARYTFDVTHPKVSMGCFVRIGNFDGTTSGSYDLIAMEGVDGEFAVLNFQDFPGNDFVFQIHTQAGVNDAFPVTPNTTYWMTLLWDQPNRRAYLKVYDAMTWQLVGNSSIALENQPCQTVCFGRYDEHAATTSALHYYDDLMIDYSAAHFPILPARIGPAGEPITLATDGSGTISGATNNQLLEFDRTYTLTAKPATGNLFAGWTGSTSSPSASLKFLMASNLTFTAHFVTNPFPQLKGSYTGLFYNSTNTEQRSSGYLKLTLGSSGSYSAKVSLNGKSYSKSGVLAPDGSGVCVFPRAGTNALEMSLTLDLSNHTDRIDGLIVEQATDGASWSAALRLNRPTFNKDSPAPNFGRYTFTVGPDYNSPNSPQGYGYGILTLSSMGTLVFVGTLADGTKVSQGTALSKSGDWPLYLPLYKGKGSLICPAVLDTNQPDDDITGAPHWFKQTQASATIYPDGFTSLGRVVGSRFQPPSLTNPLLELVDGTFGFSLDNFSTIFANLIRITPQNTIVNLSGNKLFLSVSKSTGRFTGSAVAPSGGKPISFSGVLLQRQILGAGFFIETNRSGNVILGP